MILSLKALKRSSVKVLPEELLSKIGQDGHLFNPSYLRSGDTEYCAFRKFCAVEKRVKALLLIWNRDREQQIDLSEYYFDRAGIHTVADPKLFLMEGVVHLTFNTGWEAKPNHNQIYLSTVEGFELGQLYKCSYNNRARIEKNWAFFKQDGNLKVLYSCNPLVVLEQKKALVDDGELVFQDHFKLSSTKTEELTIGTQLARKGQTYFFVAHRKIRFKKKRLYLGYLCRFKPTQAGYDIVYGKKGLIHSLRSMWGSKTKLNKNLLSCTYFSGIDVVQDRLLLSYGINDLDYNFCTLNLPSYEN